VDLVATVHARILRAFERSSLRPANGRLLCACSGGPDSSVLLDALAALAPSLGLELTVATVDHGLRAAAAEESRAVVAAAERLGLGAVALRVTVERPTMAAARRARYQALIGAARAVGAGAIAVGHTATDQAETLLDRLVRGAGTRALGAMVPARPAAPGVMLIRPLLDVEAAEIEAYVAARGLAVARDPTNHDRRYRRSRLRHEVLPLLRGERPGLDRALAQLCDRLRADGEALDAQAAAARARLTDGEGWLDVAGLMGLAAALRARVLHAAAPIGLEAVHLEAIARLCGDRDGTRSIALPSRMVAERRYGRLRLGPPPVDPGPVEVPVAGPGVYSFLDGAVEISGDALAHLGGAPLTLRNPRPGDRMAGRSIKLKEVLIDRRVPRPERSRLPVLARGHEVLWAAGVFGEGPVCTR
jgi:tRNA(Ile)-lysidine synthetase-like protein